MPTYPSYIGCPSCGGIASNLTVTLAELVDLIRKDPSHLDRTLLQTDAGKPGPSHRLVVCQHCHFPFRANPRLVINSPRTLVHT